MKRCGKHFLGLLEGFELDTLEQHPHSIFALSQELSLEYLNPAWFAFAQENNGEPAISQRFGIGTKLDQVIPEPLRNFYLEAYREVLRSGEPWHHDYECSSPDTYRLYHAIVYAFHNRQGLLVVNSLVNQQPHSAEMRAPFPPNKTQYTGANGLIIQCCHCRRTQRVSPPDVWDWVPEWVNQMPLNSTSGLCPVCYDYYWVHRAKAPYLSDNGPLCAMPPSLPHG